MKYFEKQSRKELNIIKFQKTYEVTIFVGRIHQLEGNAFQLQFYLKIKILLETINPFLVKHNKPVLFFLKFARIKLDLN